MRRQDHIRQLAQRMIDRQRLGVEDVEPGAGDPIFLQRLDQRGSSTQRPARGVDQISGRLHLRQFMRADQSARARAQHEVHGDEVGVAKQLFFRRVRRPPRGISPASGSGSRRSPSCRRRARPGRRAARAARAPEGRASCRRGRRRRSPARLARPHAGIFDAILRPRSISSPMVSSAVGWPPDSRAAYGDAAILDRRHVDCGVAHAGGDESFRPGSRSNIDRGKGVRSRIAQ